MCTFVCIQYQNVTDGQTDRNGKTISRSACYRMLTPGLEIDLQVRVRVSEKSSECE